MSITSTKTLKTYKLLELYSGIGGMRFAFESSGVSYEVVAAVDINTVVNDTYRHNFGPENHFQRNIQSFTVEEVEAFEADIVTMSPPCQPFTRVGLKLDSQDARSESFLHLLTIFKKLKRKPPNILLENVKGFECSDARKILIETLDDCGYCYQEFLLSPLQFGIPNSRLRYYLLAKLKPSTFIFPVTDEVLHHMPNVKLSEFYCTKCKASQTAMKENMCCEMKHFLEDGSNSYFEKFRLSANTLEKHAFVLDIVEENSQASCCFTKAYGHFLQGTGSVLHPSNAFKVSDVYSEVSKIEDIQERVELLKNLKLRYFTPREIANVMCFPERFSFPENLTLKQMYRALGNSINVFVVSSLLSLILSET